VISAFIIDKMSVVTTSAVGLLPSIHRVLWKRQLHQFATQQSPEYFFFFLRQLSYTSDRFHSFRNPFNVCYISKSCSLWKISHTFIENESAEKNLYPNAVMRITLAL
jgi:hypothetical protein